LSCTLLCFFFQAEDGIRDRNVTGVQTCALPISWREPTRRRPSFRRWWSSSGTPSASWTWEPVFPRAFCWWARQAPARRCLPRLRSEERRVGKECRAGGSPEDDKKEEGREESVME